METVFDALKALKKASSQVVASRLGISREEAVNELWKLKRRGEADNKGSMWWLIQAGESESVSPVPKVTAQMLTEAIEQHGPQTADELALMFGYLPPGEFIAGDGNQQRASDSSESGR